MCSSTQAPDPSEKGGRDQQTHPSTWWVPPHCLRAHLWTPVLLVLTFHWPDKYFCISSLLVGLFFVPELSPREDQCLIPTEILSRGQQIPSSDPVRSHSLWYWSGWSDKKISLMLFDATFLYRPRSWSPALRDHGSRRSKDRVAHIRKCWRCRSSLVSELQKVADAASNSAWNGKRCRYWLSGGRM